MSPQIHPAGFRISDRPVAASFAHTYSFQLVSDPFLRDEACIASSLGLGGLEGSWVKYWDDSSTTAILQFEVKPSIPTIVQSAKVKKDKQKYKGPQTMVAVRNLADTPLSDGDIEQRDNDSRAEASVLPRMDTPLTISLNKSHGGKPPGKPIGECIPRAIL